MPKLNIPMTAENFQHITLLANADAVVGILIGITPAGNKRRAEYAKLRREIKRVEDSIPGYLDGRCIDASKRLYAEMETAIRKFLRSFNDIPPQVGRDARGRWCRLAS